MWPQRLLKRDSKIAQTMGTYFMTLCAYNHFMIMLKLILHYTKEEKGKRKMAFDTLIMECYTAIVGGLEMHLSTLFKISEPRFIDPIQPPLY
jgi:hypothetical protein